MRKPRKQATRKIPLPETGNAVASGAANLFIAVAMIALGTMLATIPVLTGAWIMGGCLILWVACKFYNKCEGKARVLLIAICASIATVLFGLGYREFIGSNYQISYRVCGAPIFLPNGKVARFQLGTEWVNQNSIDLVLLPENIVLTANDRSSTVPVNRVPTKISAAEDGKNIMRSRNMVAFDPPVNATGAMRGRILYSIKYGRDDENIRNRLTLDGTFEVLFTENGRHEFQFSPSSKSSPGFIGTCEIEDFIYGTESISL